MNDMNYEQYQREMRLAIESVCNFLKKPKETETKQLDDNSKHKILGDPLTDVKMNQNANELGSDGKNAPTVSVTPGSAKGGDNFEAGQHKAQFKDRTKLAEDINLLSEKELRAYIVNILKEQFEAKLKEEENVLEGAADELLGVPEQPIDEKSSEIDESGRSHSLGRISNLKPNNYPKNLKR